ncbi:MAG: C39 family peptidase, partial [Bacillus sp. (in: firmicutes)]
MNKILSLLAVLVIVVAVLNVVFLHDADAKPKEKEKAKQEERVIPYPEGYDLSSGAAGYKLMGNHESSPYFSTVDYYNAESNQNRTLLDRFKTYQQTKEYTCGPASALMVLHHFNNKKYDELTIAKMMKTHIDIDGDNKDEQGVANERGEWGTSTDKMVSFFKQIGWNVQSSLETKDEAGFSFASPDEFK